MPWLSEGPRKASHLNSQKVVPGTQGQPRCGEATPWVAWNPGSFSYQLGDSSTLITSLGSQAPQPPSSHPNFYLTSPLKGFQRDEVCKWLHTVPEHKGTQSSHYWSSDHNLNENSRTLWPVFHGHMQTKQNKTQTVNSARITYRKRTPLPQVLSAPSFLKGEGKEPNIFLEDKARI